MDRATARVLIDSLNRDAERIAGHFGLRYESIQPERANVKSRYGVCYADGSIRIRLRHAATGRPLKYSSLVNTLCHELAHLRHFDHGERFRAFYQEVLEWARAQGIYRPAGLRRGLAPPRPTTGGGTAGAAAARRAGDPTPGTPAPAQLSLF